MQVFHLPDLGEGLPEADVIEWYVAEGDVVAVDQPLVAMESAKAVVDIPSPVAGRIARLCAKPGETVPTGAVLVEFEGDGPEQAVAHEGVAQAGGDAPAAPARESTAPAAVRAMPAVRARARREGIDLAAVAGSGEGGRVRMADLARRPAEAPAEERLSGVRRTMAENMARSHAEVVPATVFDDADVHDWPAGTDITARLVRALVAACRVSPALNAWFDGARRTRVLHEAVHVGVAVDTEDGLFVPVLRDAQTMDATRIRTEVERLRAGARARSLAAEELSGATLTLSNFGMLAGRHATPVVVPPTVAILGTGRAREMPVARGGGLHVHRMLPLSLSFDHRAVTGAEAARFLAALMDDLQAAD